MSVFELLFDLGIGSGEMDSNNKDRIFFPYYVNQGRLMDIYAMYHGGYSEYADILVEENKHDNKRAEATIKALSGFKIFSIGADASVAGEHGRNNKTETKEKKVQTVASMLSTVIDTFEQEKFFSEITEAEPGMFVLIPVSLTINSIKSVMDETTGLMKLITSMEKLGVKVDITKKDTKDIENLAKSLKALFDGEEIVCERNDYAIFGNIVNSHLYQGITSDLVGTELKCFAQVKRVYPEGTELLRNTFFAKIKDKQAKEECIKAIQELSNGEEYDFEASTIGSIYGKPVYQLEVIALFQ